MPIDSPDQFDRRFSTGAIITPPIKICFVFFNYFVCIPMPDYGCQAKVFSGGHTHIELVKSHDPCYSQLLIIQTIDIRAFFQNVTITNGRSIWKMVHPTKTRAVPTKPSQPEDDPARRLEHGKGQQ